MPPDTATIEIVRNTPDDVQDRWVRIHIDDTPEEILRYGETLRRHVPPGRHRIKAHNTLFGHTLNVDVAPGEAVRLTCQNGITGGGMLMVLMLGVAYLRVRLERET